MADGVRWRGSINIRAMHGRFNALVYAKTEQYGPITETYAKVTAPWTDRTGAARQLLHASVDHSPNHHRIILSHGVPYGIWLEVRHNGRYAVILPTIKHVGEKLMNDLENIMHRVD